MKKIIFYLIITLFCFNVNSQINLEQGLIAFYPFNGNSIDESPNNNNGNVIGPTLVDDRFNNSNSAYNFDGNDYIIVNDSPSLRLTNFSISLWCKFDNTSGLQLILDKHLGTGSLDSYEIWFQSNKAWGTISNFSGFDNYVDTALTPQINTWYHIVYTFDDDNNTQALYIDSVLGSSIGANKSISYDNEPLMIGASNDQQVPQYFFKGNIDDIKIYNRVINQDEITALYTETLSINELETTTFSLYPNPTSSAIKINSKQLIEEVIVYSLKGQIIYKKPIQNTFHDIDVSNISDGPYVLSVKVKTNEGTGYYRKLFVKR